MVFVSCSKDSPNDSTDSNNFYSKQIGIYTFISKPFNAEKLIKLNYKESFEKLSAETKDSIIKEYNNYMCFLFEIKIDGFTGDIVEYDEPKKESDYNKKLSYYLFEMQKDFSLKDSKGLETPCTIYYFERLSEIAKTNKFIVGFNKVNSDGITFEYNNQIINCGNIKFNIRSNQLALN